MKKSLLVGLVLLMLGPLSLPAFAALEKGKTVLVTGANRGIGLELATQLQASGVKVIATARKPAQAKALSALGVQVEQLDVADAASVAALAQRLKGVPIDALINNAGVGGDSNEALVDLDIDRFEKVFAVNSTGPVRVTVALLDNLKAGQNKLVVNMSSIMASLKLNWGGSYSYRASKTALNMLSSTMAHELGKDGFTVVMLHPGWVKTRMGGESAPLAVADSVKGLISVIASLEAADNGSYVDYQGKPIPW